jgi:hypothetical protein
VSHEVLPPAVRLIGAAVLLLFLGWVVAMVRGRRLSLRDSLVWLLSTTAALALTAFPQLLVLFARAVGVEIPANALFGTAILYLSVNVLSVTVAGSLNAARVRRLTQECALLRAEIERLRGAGGGPA